MTAVRKTQSPAHVVKAIDRIELLADKYYRRQPLLNRSWSLASWAILTESIRVVETSIPAWLYGSRSHINAATNMSMIAALLCKSAMRLDKNELFDASKFLWTTRLADELRSAFGLSRRYLSFCTAFPYWHADLYAAELINDDVVRFFLGASTIGRRFNAYLQGIRPHGASNEAGMPTSPELRNLFNRALSAAIKVSKKGVVFPKLDELHRAMYRSHGQRTSAMIRWNPVTTIGAYTLDDFRRFYSALNAVAGTHEYLCYLWSEEHGLPLDSLVLFNHRARWADELSALAKLPREQVQLMIRDTTFGRVFAIDFHTLPFVPLAHDGAVLALAPFCSLSSHWEENILRCLSRHNSNLYSSNSVTKEDGMRRPLLALTSGTRLISGPHKLIKPAPDIDLIVQDLRAKILMVCELKWVRKPNGVRERQQRDAEVSKGFSQIDVIRKFVESDPGYLYRRGIIGWNLSEFERIHYCVVARDHIVEPPSKGAAIYGYEEFLAQLAKTGDTKAILDYLENLRWLPIEGVEFKVHLERHRVGPVALESEIYYPAPGPLAMYP
jgi:hypothetical protein